MDTGRQILAAGLVVVVINFFWFSNSAGHTTVAWVWLLVDLLLWLPELKRLWARL